MRPIELTLSGFHSYAGTATFGFTGRRLVGVVGPIGSGKSSLLDAVAFAHRGGVIHRDLKTANVLLDEERGAQLTDFGFARMVAERYRTNHHVDLVVGGAQERQLLAVELAAVGGAGRRGVENALGHGAGEEPVGSPRRPGGTRAARWRAMM